MKSAIATHTVVVVPALLTADFIFSPASPVAGATFSFTEIVSGGTPPAGLSWGAGGLTPPLPAPPPPRVRGRGLVRRHPDRRDLRRQERSLQPLGPGGPLPPHRGLHLLPG